MADEVNNQAVPAEQPAVAPATSPDKNFIWGTGRRKKAIARVRIRLGSGKFTVNRRELEEYFKNPRDVASAKAPLVATKVTTYDVWANVLGGGITGQADAIKLGLARALIKASADLLPPLRDLDLITRDARMKERKKYGQKGARKRFQFSKR